MCSQRYDSRAVITTLLQGERWIQPVPLGRFQATQMSLSRQHPLIPPQILPVWELQAVLQVCRSDPESLDHQCWSRRLQPDTAGGAHPCPGPHPPRPQHTLPLAGEALPLFQADNRPFPGKSLHAAVQTDPQSTAAVPGLKGQTHRQALFSAKGKQKLFVPEGGNSDSSTPLRWTCAGGLELG